MPPIPAGRGKSGKCRKCEKLQSWIFRISRVPGPPPEAHSGCPGKIKVVVPPSIDYAGMSQLLRISPTRVVPAHPDS